MVDIVLDVQVVSQGDAATKCDTAGAEWGGDLSTEVGGLVMAPTIQLAGNQLLAGAMPTHPPHAGLGPSVQWIPLQYKDTLWGSPFPLPSEEAAGFPKLCLGGVPGCIRLLPKLPSGSPCRQRHLREEPLLGQGGLIGSLAHTCSCSCLGSWGDWRCGDWDQGLGSWMGGGPGAVRGVAQRHRPTPHLLTGLCNGPPHSRSQGPRWAWIREEGESLGRLTYKGRIGAIMVVLEGSTLPWETQTACLMACWTSRVEAASAREESVPPEGCTSPPCWASLPTPSSSSSPPKMMTSTSSSTSSFCLLPHHLRHPLCIH